MSHFCEKCNQSLKTGNDTHSELFANIGYVGTIFGILANSMKILHLHENFLSILVNKDPREAKTYAVWCGKDLSMGFNRVFFT